MCSHTNARPEWPRPAAAALLKTAEGWLTDEERGFEPLCGSVALSYGTASIHHPGRWLPHMAFRFFRPEPNDQHRVAFVSVILCPRTPDKHERDFEEPIVTAGWFRFAEPCEKFTAYWWSGMATWFDIDRDGTLGSWRADPGDTCESGTTEQHVLAVPLVEVTSSDVLVERVLKPLVGSLQGGS